MMNIYAKEGSEIIYTANGGYDSDIALGDKHLNIGETYVVDYTEVGGWHTNVFLKGFVGIPFNSAIFEDSNGKS